MGKIELTFQDTVKYSSINKISSQVLKLKQKRVVLGFFKFNNVAHALQVEHTQFNPLHNLERIFPWNHRDPVNIREDSTGTNRPMVWLNIIQLLVLITYLFKQLQEVMHFLQYIKFL